VALLEKYVYDASGMECQRGRQWLVRMQGSHLPLLFGAGGIQPPLAHHFFDVEDFLRQGGQRACTHRIP
jgi:hypothetical protein